MISFADVSKKSRAGKGKRTYATGRLSRLQPSMLQGIENGEFGLRDARWPGLENSQGRSFRLLHTEIASGGRRTCVLHSPCMMLDYRCGERRRERDRLICFENLASCLEEKDFALGVGCQSLDELWRRLCEDYTLAAAGGHIYGRCGGRRGRRRREIGRGRR